MLSPCIVQHIRRNISGRPANNKATQRTSLDARIRRKQLAASLEIDLAGLLETKANRRTKKLLTVNAPANSLYFWISLKTEGIWYLRLQHAPAFDLSSSTS